MKLKINRDQASEIYQYIKDNGSDYILETTCYVGDACVNAVMFGEQEEQLDGIYNHKTGKNYSLKYLKKVFNNSGYYISGNYAYYDLSYNGVGLFLVDTPKIPLLEKLYKNIK